MSDWGQRLGQALVYFFSAGLIGTLCWTFYQVWLEAADRWRLEKRISEIGADIQRDINARREAEARPTGISARREDKR